MKVRTVLIGFVLVTLLSGCQTTDQTRINDAQQSVKDNAKFPVSFCGNDTVQQVGENYVVTGCVKDDSGQQGTYIVNMDSDDNINGGTITGISN